jgi:hypothetical protein
MANPDVLLISEEKIKAYTNLNTNLSPEDLQPFIWDAQNILLPNYLGATYYNALKSRIVDGTLTAADEYLLDNYIGQMLCNWGFYYSTTFIQYRSYNKGILKGTAESGQPLDLDELKFLQSQIKNIAEGYTQQMILYLLTHSTDYPLYNSPDSNDGPLPDKSNPYTTNIVIPSYPYAYQQRFIRRNGYGNGYGGYYSDGFVGIDCYNLPNSGN